ncbi:unnamed protein product [Leptidea sinapis]|uniref:EF-hand domain-containing protein n=1 Tax=Leptidea sinapis TaxID=189913 RepID=A0A5E4PX52_9NEOP|nr:unnamed protein product [Leptidea sinapis]
MVAKIQGWNEDELERKAAHRTMLQIWEGFTKAADKDSDGKISSDEWIAMWTAQDKNSMAEWQKQYCKVLFNIQDVSGDGVVNGDEFVQVHLKFDIPKDEAIEAFKKLSGGKSSITYEDFEKLYQDYFYSDDVNAPGNHLFGTN